MFDYYYSKITPEKSYFAKGALEIEMSARETEKKLALMTAELAAEESEAKQENRPSSFKVFFANLFSGFHTTQHQAAGLSHK